MSRIVLAWELGKGFGHVTRMAMLARALQAHGHEPVFVVRDLTALSGWLKADTVRAYQAPVWIGDVSGLPLPINYAEMLLRFGFYDASALTAVVRAWKNLFDLLQPDLILFDHAPSALLATHGTGVARALYGDGFCSPPALDPCPPFHWWQPPSPRLTDSTKQVLAVANKTLVNLGAPRLGAFAELFATDENFLLAFDEIDHYPNRTAARYWGPIFATDEGITPQWPLSGSRRVFCYLDPSQQYFEPLIGALAQSDASSLVFAPGVSARSARSLSSATLSISDTAFDMRRVARECDFGITQSGMGTACALLIAGKPQLLVPTYVERLMLAKRIEALGAANILFPDVHKSTYRSLIKRVLRNDSLSAAATAVRLRYANYDQEQTVAAIANRCVELLEQRAPAGAMPVLQGASLN